MTRAKYFKKDNRRDPTEISDVLGALIEKAYGQIDVRQGDLVTRWNEIAPQDWREVSTPIGIKEKTLLVEVETGTAASLLKYQIHQLIGAIRDVYGDDLVDSVKLRVSR